MSSSVEMSNIMLRELCEKAQRGLKLAKASRKQKLIGKRKEHAASQSFFAKLFRLKPKILSDSEAWSWYMNAYHRIDIIAEIDYHGWVHYGDETFDIIKKLLIACDYASLVKVSCDDLREIKNACLWDMPVVDE